MGHIPAWQAATRALCWATPRQWTAVAASLCGVPCPAVAFTVSSNFIQPSGGSFAYDGMQIRFFGSAPAPLNTTTTYFATEAFASGSFRVASSRVNAYHWTGITLTNTTTGTVGRADDDGIIIRPTTNPQNGYWERIRPRKLLRAEWFGALGGEFEYTAIPDMTAAIRKVRDAQPNHGAKIIFPSGRYGVASNIEWAPGFLMEGEGPRMTLGVASAARGAVIISTANGITAFSVGDAQTGVGHEGCSFHNMSFLDQTSRTATLLRIRLQNYWVVDECSFGNAAIGLELDADDAGPGHGGTTVGGDASWGYVKDCFLRDNTRGIKTSHGSAGYLMSGGAIQNHVDSTAWGIEQHGGAQLKVHGVKFDSVGTESGGIWMKGEASTIRLCEFENMGCGVKVDGISGNTVDGKLNRIFDCYFQNLGASAYGVEITSLANYTKLRNNNFMMSDAPHEVLDNGTNTSRTD